MNRKDKFYKEYLKVQDRYDELWDIKRNQSLIKLDVPYKRGYNKTYDLRSDIKNREDAWVFYKCLELINGSIWCVNKKFLSKSGKGKYVERVPQKNWINESTFESLRPQVKKYFYKVEKQYRRIEYHCSLSFELVFKIKPNLITHYRQHDELIEQEFAEIRSLLLYKFYKFEYGYRSFTGSYQAINNRKDRAFNRACLEKNKKVEDFDKYEYKYKHRHSAIYDAW